MIVCTWFAAWWDEIRRARPRESDSDELLLARIIRGHGQLSRPAARTSQVPDYSRAAFRSKTDDADRRRRGLWRVAAAHAALLGNGIDLYWQDQPDAAQWQHGLSGPKQLVQVYSLGGTLEFCWPGAGSLLARRNCGQESLQEAMRSLRTRPSAMPALELGRTRACRGLAEARWTRCRARRVYLAVGLGPRAVASLPAKQADAVVGLYARHDSAGGKGAPG